MCQNPSKVDLTFLNKARELLEEKCFPWHNKFDHNFRDMSRSIPDDVPLQTVEKMMEVQLISEFVEAMNRHHHQIVDSAMIKRDLEILHSRVSQIKSEQPQGLIAILSIPIK